MGRGAGMREAVDEVVGSGRVGTLQVARRNFGGVRREIGGMWGIWMAAEGGECEGSEFENVGWKAGSWKHGDFRESKRVKRD